MNFILKFEAKLAKFEEFLLAFFIVLMIIVSVLQIVLRNFFNTGIYDGDVFARALVLWVGFIGANLAVRRNKHINIDLFSKLISNPKWINLRFIILNLFSFIFTLILAYFSIEYFFLEYENSMNSFFNVPTYIVFLIVPFSLTIMFIRFLLQAIIKTTLEKEE
jgi:TRAP-type C4-dicarboxylate transport system permease small subunit